MQFKRPINLPRLRKTGVRTFVNSFQFLRANKLILSVKVCELVNGWEIPDHIMARCRGEPLTQQELADWRVWKASHDAIERVAVERTRYTEAGGRLAACLRDTCIGLDEGFVVYDDSEASVLWGLLDEFGRRLAKAGLQRPKRSRGRPVSREIGLLRDLKV